MEKLLLRECVLVGQSPRRSFRSPKTQRGSSDVNFHDVFGGPPRRSSLQDRRRQGLGDSMWSREEEEGEEETSSSRDVWSGLGEKPVFGDEVSSRQRYPSDDFFDDIFRGDESSESTLRKFGWDASRIGSPGRMHSDPFASSSLSPTLSLPTKLANDNEYPAFSAASPRSRKNSENSPLALGFPSSPSVSTSRFSSQAIQGQDGLKNDMQYNNHGQSSLSREFSLNSRGSSQATTSDKQETEGFLKNGSSSLEVSDSNSHFHFSIYKWASTRLPVVMPLREGNSLSFKRRDNPEKRMIDFPALVQQGDKLPSYSDSLTAANNPILQDSRDQDGNLVLNMKNDRVDTYEVVSAKPVSQPLTEFQNIVNEIPMKIDSSESTDKRIPTSKQEAQKPELSPLYSPLINDSDRQGKQIKRGFGAFGAALNKVLSESTEKKSPISKKVANDLEPNPMYCLLTDDSDRKANICEPERLEKSKSVSKKKGQKPEANALYCLLVDEFGRQGNDKAVEQGREGKMKSANTSAERVESHKKEKKQNGKKNKSSPINSSLKDSPVNREEKVGDNKIKEKVKHFVKIFNRESPSKLIVNSEALDNSASVKDGGSRTEDRESIDAVKIHQKEKLQVDQIQKQSEKPHVEVSTAAWKQSEKPEVEVNTAARKQLEKPEVEVITAARKQSEKTQVEVNTEAQKQSEQPKVEVKTAARKIYTVSSAEPIRESTEAATNVDESHYADLNCTIKELPDDQNKQPQSDQPTEDLQVWDAKIRKWSNGKEHNIRSLLSTLQYVLWPESGWKPVPLVDIIEGNPVRRAYQKALLCLHPDKLQQKGAAPHQKYIAERVFDILQEAWTQFNSLGSF